MKKTLSYPERWRQKQRELPVKGNQDEQWLRMRATLDQRMPSPGVIKKPFRIKLPKWGLKVLVGISAAAAVYLGGNLYLSARRHQPVKPGIPKIHRNSPSPANNDTLPLQGSFTHAGTTPLYVHQAKPNTDTIIKPGERIPDTIKTPAILNAPFRRDSMIMPIEAAPLKPHNDSISPVELKSKEIGKDTSANKVKAIKKKRRPKVSVFF